MGIVATASGMYPDLYMHSISVRALPDPTLPCVWAVYLVRLQI